MGVARTLALRLRRDRGLSAVGVPTMDDLIGMATGAGGVVDFDQPFAGEVREVYSAGSIGLRAGMSTAWQRWCLAHATGHLLQHADANHLYLARANRRYHVDRNETAAEMFAGHLIFGELADPPPGVRDVLTLATWADVPFACAVRWVRLIEYLASVPLVADRYDVRLVATGGVGRALFRDAGE